MFEHEWLDDARMAAVEAALAPYQWRRMTLRAVAHRLVAAVDGDAVITDDGRVWMVERALSSCRWRALTLAGVAQQAAGALETWHASWQRLELELSRLLDANSSRPDGPAGHPFGVIRGRQGDARMRQSQSCRTGALAHAGDPVPSRQVVPR